jgi:hypothetical protein
LNEIEEYFDGHRYQHCCERENNKRDGDGERGAQERKPAKYKKKNKYLQRPREREERESKRIDQKTAVVVDRFFACIYVYTLYKAVYIYI